VLIALALLGRIGRDAVRQAGTTPAAEDADRLDGSPDVAGTDRITWVLALLVLMTLGPRLLVLLT
jgi:hypothetical protein